ncbi:MAG: hypothetical protein QW590_00555 [Candidatus Bilamarchaeaceae archaeon]
MVKRSRGSLSKTTKRMKKAREVTVSAMARRFNVGDNVHIRPLHVVRARPPHRYAGRRGRVVEKRGNSYVVEILDGGKIKKIITTAIHLVPSR